MTDHDICKDCRNPAPPGADYCELCGMKRQLAANAKHIEKLELESIKDKSWIRELESRNGYDSRP